MALREYTDPDGVRWQVWRVQPTLTFGPARARRDRRQQTGPLQGPDRRTLADRRILELSSGMEKGWLCFEREGAKRRLSPVPEDWETCTEEALVAYQHRATPVQPRGSARKVLELEPPPDPAG